MIPVLLRGPAGSGKTFRCLAEIADHLRKNPEGDPLILLAPRQATYQLERQILSMPGVEGFSRLRILSFQRLAQFVFELTAQPEPKLLDEQGRVMVLRAILGRRSSDLKMYGKGAHREALAQELGLLWRELCEHNVGPAALRAASARVPSSRLQAKLSDFAEIFEEYSKWLESHGLRDGDELLDIAADAALKGPLPKIAGLWLDGFAQMTPQERRLLNAVLRSSDSATLAFCLPDSPITAANCFSMWGVMSLLHAKMRGELQQIFGGVKEEVLPRRITDGRFDGAPALAHIEQHWGNPCAFNGESKNVRVVKCANIEEEAVFTAREILKFVRGGGRFRETAVLVRSLDGASDVLRRVFHRYGIKFFMDRREAVAHHPLAELTRGALRTIALGYKQHELFCALKSGLLGIEANLLDWFENMALARGWHGDAWTKKLPCGPKAKDWEIARAEEIRQAALGPIFKLQKKLGAKPSGKELADGLREFWRSLQVEEQLTDWAEKAHEATHTTVWTQMEEWLKSIELAFATEHMTLLEWLGVVEAGLASLSVGLIPPALDQTLVGAVDRSRNPDLKAVFLLGVNEGVFPRRGKEPLLINDSERLALDEVGVGLGVTSLWDLGAEQFYGYIACTRARESLTLTFSEVDPAGQPLNPSLFIGHLQRLFPKLTIEEFAQPGWTDAEAPHELNRVLFHAARQNVSPMLCEWPVLRTTWERANAARVEAIEKLDPSTVRSLYGKTIRTSVSRLEQFAMCPFRFFVRSGLHAEERLLFELDKREEGSFQHEILAEFHRRVEKLGKHWRDVSFDEARALISSIAEDLKPQFQEGLVDATPSNRFRAEVKTENVIEFLRIYLQLLKECDFSPRHVELNFGEEGPLPLWIVPVDAERALHFSGRIDRVDVWVDQVNRQCYVAIFDYKSSKKELERALVQNAIQQQLPAYLAALEKTGNTLFGLPVKAAGAFYVNLRLKISNGQRSNEEEALEFKQFGVFDFALKEKLDPKSSGALFHYSEKAREGEKLHALPSDKFKELLATTEREIRTLGERIFAGDFRIDPYQHKKKTPCQNCFYIGICRVDSWTHPFRKLE